MIEFDVCPSCNSDDTSHEDDLLYDNGFTVRKCDSCNKYYKVYWETKASRSEMV